MKLHTLRYSNPLSAILEDFLSIRFKPHQVVNGQNYCSLKYVSIERGAQCSGQIEEIIPNIYRLWAPLTTLMT